MVYITATQNIVSCPSGNYLRLKFGNDRHRHEVKRAREALIQFTQADQAKALEE